MTAKPRDRTVDIAKGLAIIIMIMGHAMIGVEDYDRIFSIWYHAWHMPIFYVFSGYFFSGKDSDPQTYILRKTKQLLVPFFCWGMIHILYNLINHLDINEMRSAVIVGLFIKPTEVAIADGAAIWFLASLFWMNIVFFILIKILNNSVLLYVISFCIGICGMVAVQHGINLPLGIDASLVGIPCMAAGYFMKEYQKVPFLKHILSLKVFELIPFAVISTMLIFYNGEVNFRGGGYYQNWILTYVNGVVGTILIWNIAYKLNGIKKGRIRSVFLSIGCNSIIYLVMNQRVISWIKPAFSSFMDGGVTYCCISFFITVAAVVLICYVLGEAILGCPRVRFLIGK